MPEQNAGHGLGAGDAGPVDVFLKSGPGQTAVMATLVTFAGQAAAQLGLAPPGPTLAAIAFALLVAVYNVRTVQKMQGLNCLILIPIVALVAFTSGWGANGLIGAAGAGGKTGQSELALLVDALKQETASLEQRLKLQAAELRILRELSGMHTESVPGRSGHLENGSGSVVHLVRSLLDVLAPSAHAQPTTTRSPLSATERAKLLRELQEYQPKQKALADETERLRREREEAEKRAQQLQRAPGGLWKKW